MIIITVKDVHLELYLILMYIHAQHHTQLEHILQIYKLHQIVYKSMVG